MQNKHVTAPDEATVSAAQSGSEAAADKILIYYDSFITKLTCNYRVAGGDFDDLRQEARIGLLKAIQTYRYNRGASFNTFAKLCIISSVKTAIKNSNRDKHRPLNTFISFAPNDELRSKLLITDPTQNLINKADVEQMYDYAENLLSDYEKTVFDLYLSGYEYQEIANTLGKTPKSVDNAITRIKLKLKTVKAV